jgi:flagellin-specific chaperone FliS
MKNGTRKEVVRTLFDIRGILDYSDEFTKKERIQQVYEYINDRLTELNAHGHFLEEALK